MKIQLQLAQTFLAFVFLVSPIVRAADPTPAPRATVKLLTVGNSFADNSTHFLPELSKAGGKNLILFRANLGGHSLQQHVSYIEAFEANPDDPKGSPYQAKVDPVTKQKSGGVSLRTALQKEPWDVVTIQQVSHQAPKYETYQPYAGTLIAYIHKYAPQAQILVQETWAYPEDCPRYSDPKFPYLQNPETMYQGLKAAYSQLSADTGLSLIPVGDAFHAVLTGPHPIRMHGKTADGKGDIHANANGEFRGAAMFYEMIFRDSVLSNPYIPQGVTPEDAKMLREVAHETVAKAAKK
jgi:hypothetical protein